MFALLTGMINLADLFLDLQLGNIINSFIGVTESNLSDLWKLCSIQAICALIPLTFICLIPTREQVEVV